MRVPHSLFKAYDIRRTYPDEINTQTVYAIARAYATFLTTTHKRDAEAMTVVVGADARVSSPELFREAARGLSKNGIDVIDIGEVSTPIFYFAVRHFRAHGGVMVTASHNPANYNGLKLTREEAIPIGQDSGLHDIKRFAEEEHFSQPENAGAMRKENIWQAYVEHTIHDIKITKSLKVVIDAGNGMAGAVVPRILPRFSMLETTPLFFDIDFTFPNHEANPIKAKNVAALRRKVTEINADIGVAYDGDCDRVGFVTEEGVTVPGDIITALIAQELLKKHPRATILYDLRSSRIVKETIEAYGGRAVETRVGHVFIKKQMRNEDALFAGELSSHFYYQEEGYVENSDRTMLLILELLSRSGKKLSELVKPLHKYFQSGEINSKVKDMPTVLRELKKTYRDAEHYELDGLTVRYPDWWFNVRTSNTEPVIRLNLEANTYNLMAKKRDEVLVLIRSQK